MVSLPETALADQPARTAAPHPSRARWIAAALLILYGFAKLNGSQFTVLDSELTKPMGEVSGFWLTWYYFSYSPVYGTLIALVQIVGAALLIWPRTALAAALTLVPVVTNIILIDLFYGVAADAMLVAVLILGCLLAVIRPHAGRLLAAVLVSPPPRTSGVVRAAVLASMLVVAWAFTWWVANYNNRAPTRIDGVWSVASDAQATWPWREVFFERNRAHMAVFRDANRRDRQHHFEVGEDGVVRVWETWLRKDELIMEGRVVSDTEIELAPAGAKGGAVLLRRASSRGR